MTEKKTKIVKKGYWSTPCNALFCFIVVVVFVVAIILFYITNTDLLMGCGYKLNKNAFWKTWYHTNEINTRLNENEHQQQQQQQQKQKTMQLTHSTYIQKKKIFKRNIFRTSGQCTHTHTISCCMLTVRFPLSRCSIERYKLGCLSQYQVIRDSSASKVCEFL